MNLVELQSYLDNISFGVLLLTMLVYWVGVAFPQLPLKTIGTLGMLVANLCIAALLAARWIAAGYFPLSNLYESLFFLAWGMTAIHLVAEKMSQSRLVGAATAPVAMAICAFAALTLPDEMQNSAPLVPALKSNWLMMHVSVMMISYSTLMVGAVMAITFLIVTAGQQVELQGNSLGIGGYRLNSNSDLDSKLGSGQGNRVSPGTMPTGNVATMTRETVTLSPQRLSLAQTLDNVSYRIIGLGFPLLTIGIIAGGVWANEAWGSYWSWDPKETWALITWLFFAAYLHSRITKGWQGRKPAILAATGFVVIWICYLGVNILGKGLHSYGWFFN
jgi:cytochrome c-type biogenesis protein CcsB